MSCFSSSKEEQKVPVKKRPDVIRNNLISNISILRYCYQKELDETVYTIKALVKINFIINSNGISENVHINTQGNLSEDLSSVYLMLLK